MNRSRAAILALDLIREFETEGDLKYRSSCLMPTVERIALLLDAARSHDVPIIYSNTLFETEAQYRASPLSRKATGNFVRGSSGVEAIPAVAPRNGDLIIPKTVNSAFFRTHLDDTMRGLGVERLFLCGVHTHVCVLLTAADAFYLNYDVVVVEDCVTTILPERHQFGIEYVSRHFGSVVDSDEVVRLLAKSRES